MSVTVTTQVTKRNNRGIIRMECLIIIGFLLMHKNGKTKGKHLQIGIHSGKETGGNVIICLRRNIGVWKRTIKIIFGYSKFAAREPYSGIHEWVNDIWLSFQKDSPFFCYSMKFSWDKKDIFVVGIKVRVLDDVWKNACFHKHIFTNSSFLFILFGYGNGIRNS